jgi:ribosomal protein S20
VSVIQRVGQKGIIHARQADRRVSRLAKRLKDMASK